MAYKTCPDCGTKLGSFGCPNCNEHDYISMQDCYTPAPMHQSNHTPEQRGVDVHDQLAYIIDDLSKAHDLLARTYLTNEKYNPISNILAKSKLSLADVLIKLSAILLPSKGQEGEAERKAKELISKFTFLTYQESDAKFYNPKQCALICVDEIIKLSNEDESNIHWGFWQQVRNNIVNL